MADVAELGIKVESGQVSAATNQLGALAAAAKRAGISIEEMQARVDKASRSAATFGTGLKDAAKPAADLGNVLGGKGGGGAPPLSEAADNGSRAIERLANMITRRLIFAAVILQARHAVTALLDMPRALAEVADAVDRFGVSAKGLQGLELFSGTKGIAGPEFLAGIGAFATKLQESKEIATDLTMQFRINKQTLGGTEETLAKVADMVARAGSEQAKINILTSANLPTTIAWRKFMEQGGDVIQAIVRGQRLSNGVSDEMIRKAKEFDDAWKTSWANFLQSSKSVAADVIGFLDSMSEKARQFTTSTGIVTKLQLGRNMLQEGKGTFGDFSQFAGLDKRISGAPDTVDLETQKKLNSAALQRLGILSEILTVEQKVQQTTLQINAAALNGIGITAQQKKLLEDIARAQAESARTHERAGFGLGSQREFQIQGERDLELAIRRGTVAWNERATALIAVTKRAEDSAKAMMIAGAQLPGLMRLQLEAGDLRVQLDQLGQSITTGISGPLLDMAMGTKSASDAFRDMANNIIKSILNMIIQMQIAMPIARALQGLLGGFIGGGMGGAAAMHGGAAAMHGGGLVGIHGAPRYVFPAHFNDAKHFGRGGIAGIGPDEVRIVAHRNEEILTRSDPRHRWNGGGQGSGVSVTYAPTYNVEGSGPELVALRGEMQRDRAEAPAKIIKTIQEAQSRRAL